MHRHDLDLIAALAEGSLEDETEARSLTETCQECRLEYEAQLSTLEALAGVEPALMSDVEKAALHRDLWTQLRSEGARATGGIPRWYRWSAVAAGLFIVVGLVGVLAQPGGQDAGEMAAESLAEMESVAGDEAEATTTMAAQSADDDGAPAAEDSADASGQLAPADIERLSAVTEAVRSGDFASFGSSLYQLNRSASDDQADCLEQSNLAGYQIIAGYDGDRRYLVAVPADVEIGRDTPVAFIDATTCEVVLIEE